MVSDPAQAPPATAPAAPGTGDTLVVIDGNYFAYRYFFGMPKLTASDGRPIGVLAAFADLLAKLRVDPDLSHWALVLDHPSPSFRHHLYPAYKAQRPPTPPELKTQLPLLPQVAGAFGIPVVQVAGVEGDDAIAALATLAAQYQCRARMCTGDKDLDQVLGPLVSTWDPGPNRHRGPGELWHERGLLPEQVVDYLCLVGDSADNLPGAKGVGPVRARKLLASHGDLTGIMQAADSVPGKLGEHLIAFRERADLMRQLITVAPVPGLPALQDLQVPGPERSVAIEPLTDLGLGGQRYRRATARAADMHLHLTTLDQAPPPPAIIGAVPLDDGGIALGWCSADGHTRHAMVLEAPAEHSPRTILRGLLDDWCGSPRPTAWLADARQHRPRLIELGWTAGQTHDVCWWQHRHDPWLEQPLGVDDIVNRVLGERLPRAVSPGHRAACLAACLADLGPRLAQSDDPIPDAQLGAVLAEIHQRGIALDASQLESLAIEEADYLDALASELHQAGGHNFDPLDDRQVSQWLFDRLKLPVVRRDQNGPCLDRPIIQQLAHTHDHATTLLQYRDLHHLLHRVVPDLLGQFHHHTGRIHDAPSMTACGAIRRGISALGDFPAANAVGGRLAGAFGASPSHSLLEVRWPALALGIVGTASGCEALRTAYASDDPGRIIAALIDAIEPAAVTPARAREAMTVLTVLARGGTGFALASRLGCSREAAEQALAAANDCFPELNRWVDQVTNTPLQTLTGRQLQISQLTRPPEVGTSAYRRAVIDAVVSGTAADISQLGLLACHAQLPAGCGPVFLDEDRVLFEVVPDQADAVAAMAIRAWTDLHPLPIRVVITRGTDWLSLS